eukprot:3051565-Rhodomonas_salina.1
MRTLSGTMLTCAWKSASVLCHTGFRIHVRPPYNPASTSRTELAATCRPDPAPNRWRYPRNIHHPTLGRYSSLSPTTVATWYPTRPPSAHPTRYHTASVPHTPEAEGESEPEEAVKEAGVGAGAAEEEEEGEAEEEEEEGVGCDPAHVERGGQRHDVRHHVARVVAGE